MLPPGFPATGGTGGATPTIVPFNLLGGAIGGRAGAAGALPCGGPAGGGAPAAGGGAAGAPVTGLWFIMSIVPLNLGAEAPFKLNVHFAQTWAVSGFCVPQFGQNTRRPPSGSISRTHSSREEERVRTAFSPSCQPRGREHRSLFARIPNAPRGPALPRPAPRRGFHRKAGRREGLGDSCLLKTFPSSRLPVQIPHAPSARFEPLNVGPERMRPNPGHEPWFLAPRPSLTPDLGRH
jgi:hypothetical protein